MVDLLSHRPDVDLRRIAIAGLECAGFGVARALTVERRFATALLLPGIHDASSPWIVRLPDGARAALLDEDRDRFEAEIHLASLFAPELPDLLRRSGRCFAGEGTSIFDLYRRISDYRLEEQIAGLESHTQVCEAPTGAAGQGRRPRSRAGWDRRRRSSAVGAPPPRWGSGSTLRSESSTRL